MLSLSDRKDLTINVNLSQQHQDRISENDWTPFHDSSSEKEDLRDERNSHQDHVIELERKEVEQETVYEVAEDIWTNLDDTDSILVQEIQTALQQQVTKAEEGEGLEEKEEELLHDRQDVSVHQPDIYASALEEHSVSDDSEMEEELCELVQRLRNELSSRTPTGLFISILKKKIYN